MNYHDARKIEEDIYCRMKETRRRQKLSLRALAAKTFVSKSQIAGAEELNRSLNLTSFISIMDILGYEIDIKEKN